jgi:hypothetical protein
MSKVMDRLTPVWTPQVRRGSAGKLTVDNCYAGPGQRLRRYCQVRSGQVQLFRFPFANHVQDGLLVGLGDHREFKYPGRYRVANPAAWSPYGPHLYVPDSIFNVSPAGHFISAKSAATGHFTCDASLPPWLSCVRLHIVCFTFVRNRSLANNRAVIGLAA